MPIVSGLPEKQDWTVADLESLPEDLRYELIDGRLLLLDYPPLYQIPAWSVLSALHAASPEHLYAVHRVSLLVDDANEPRPNAVVLRPAASTSSSAPSTSSPPTCRSR